MLIVRPWNQLVLVLFAGISLTAVGSAQSNFAGAVEATHPIAYYQLDATSGRSEVGASTYQAQGGVSVGSPGALGGTYAKFNGVNGWVLTTQKGGVGTAGSIMAWVNLADLPSKTGRIFYVAGESQGGNDFDVQFETDDVLKFFTAAGGHLDYAPPPESLLNHWHMLVVTLDTASPARVLYWDGEPMAKDTGGGRPNKTAAFSIGASPLWKGRWFKGGIQQVALWDRALSADQVASIYAAQAAGNAAAGDTGSADAGGAAPAAATPASGPFATKAKVLAADAKGPLQLRREEQIALMFMSAFDQIEQSCQMKLQRACSMAEALNGAGGERLKFDPNKTDPNYTYTLAAGGMAWEAHANAKKPGLRGFCFMARAIGTIVTTYSPTGKAGWVDPDLLNRSIEGELFETP
jgi:hypothetical protein